MTRQELYQAALDCAEKAKVLLERGQPGTVEEWVKLGHLYLRLSGATPPSSLPPPSPWPGQ